MSRRNGPSIRSLSASTSSIYQDLPEAPVFHPTVEEFKNPIEFIKSIRDKVADFGICRIVPPSEWDRNAFRRNIDPNTFRFPTKVQNVHQFLNRTGASEKFLKKLKKYWSRIAQQPLNSLPRVDGIEIDLSRLYNFVEEHGGSSQMDNEKWRSIAVALHVCPDAPHVISHLIRTYNRVLAPFSEYMKKKDEAQDPVVEEEQRTPRITRSKRKSFESDSSAAERERDEPRVSTRSKSKPEDKPFEGRVLRSRKAAEEPEGVPGRMMTRRSLARALRRSSFANSPNQSAICLDSDEDTSPSDTKASVAAEESDDEVLIVSESPAWRSTRNMRGVRDSKQKQPEQQLEETPDFIIRPPEIGQVILDSKPPAPKRRKIAEDATAPVSWREVRMHSFNVHNDNDRVDDVSCAICRLGDRSDRLLVCDGVGCYRGMHADCMDPPLEVIPRGDWYCDRCVAKQERDKKTDALSEDEAEESVDEFGYGSGKVYTLTEFKRMALDFERRWIDPLHALDASDTESSAGDHDDDDNTRGAHHLIDDDDEEERTQSWYCRPQPSHVESEYWRLVKSGDEHCSVTYGSDLDVGTYGSGFPLDLSVPSSNPELARWRREVASNPHMRYRNTEFMIKSGWNLNNLPYVSALQYLNESAGGVTRPMIYVGMMFSSFCWHTEDNFLYSINYVHTGAPKRWYGVPASAAHLVEQAFQGEVPHLIQKQPNLLYLLVTQIPPDLMRTKYKIPVCTTLQREGEFVVTFPRAYHAGFNNGFNVAESVNFAAPDWLPMGRLAVEEYRNKRSTVFALEELLVKSAIHAKAVNDVEFARAVRDELRTIVEADLAMLEDLESECTSSDDCLMYRYLSKEEPMGEYPQCEVCGYDCFLWNCVCECSTDTAKCLKHAKSCECPVSSKTIVARFSPDQLRLFVTKIDSRARELEIFTPIRTRSSRGNASPKKV